MSDTVGLAAKRPLVALMACSTMFSDWHLAKFQSTFPASILEMSSTSLMSLVKRLLSEMMTPKFFVI